MGKGMKKIVTQVTDNVEPIPEVELIPEVEKKVEFDLENQKAEESVEKFESLGSALFSESDVEIPDYAKMNDIKYQNKKAISDEQQRAYQQNRLI